ncbi:SubName: Full=Uncharacterized protein {ECO:0000313/EMBL:CCA69310.1} [Serendipita indica DSM 11827]|nr:SubName: Full=Uncharacterized protein {ECO:0000313/EMBL:CCA69310.1} [Serendipita indica DSM 11827]
MSSQPLPGRPERIYLPTEIWQTILRHAIFVPLFFDTDPLSSYGLAALRGYYDMSGYWDSERTRNKLRRVCSSWNAYLQHFAHRFVALKDVVHNHVPIAALPLAYRIHMTACKCFACINHGLQNTGHLASSVSRSDSKEPVDRSWRVEILEIDHHWLREDALLKILASKSHVRVYIRPLLIKVNKTIEHQSSSELRLYSGLPGTEICSVQNLSTLRLALDTSLVSTIPPMPNLKHLSVIFTDRRIPGDATCSSTGFSRLATNSSPCFGRPVNESITSSLSLFGHFVHLLPRFNSQATLSGHPHRLHTQLRTSDSTWVRIGTKIVQNAPIAIYFTQY